MDDQEYWEFEERHSRQIIALCENFEKLEKENKDLKHFNKTLAEEVLRLTKELEEKKAIISALELK